MLTSLQEKEIEYYLLSKKLSHELLMEIKDHFIQQISDTMDEKGSGFQETFLQTKIAWNHELEMVKADILSFRKIARIEKTVIQKRFWNISLYAFVFSLLVSRLMLINSDLFLYIQFFLLGIAALLLGYNLVFRKMKLYNYIQLSFHPLVLKNAFIGIAVFSSVYLFFNGQSVLGSEIMKVFFIYAVAAKIQLLYFNAKKTNVLI